MNNQQSANFLRLSTHVQDWGIAYGFERIEHGFGKRSRGRFERGRSLMEYVEFEVDEKTDITWNMGCGAYVYVGNLRYSVSQWLVKNSSIETLDSDLFPVLDHVKSYFEGLSWRNVLASGQRIIIRRFHLGFDPIAWFLERTSTPSIRALLDAVDNCSIFGEGAVQLIPIFKSLTAHSSEFVRGHAILALASAGGKRADVYSYLQMLRDDHNHYVRDIVQIALDYIDERERWQIGE